MRGDTQRARERLDLYLQGGPVPALGHLFASAWSRRLQLDPRSHCLTGLCHPDPKMSLFDHVVSEKGRRLLRTQHRQGSFLSSLQDRGLGQEQHNCPWPPGGGSGFGEVRKEQPGPPDPLPPCRRDCPQLSPAPSHEPCPKLICCWCCPSPKPDLGGLRTSMGWDLHGAVPTRLPW